VEETWELAVVSNGVFTDWSGRHTRLRYQVVLISTVFFLGSILGVSNLSNLSLVKFQKSIPNDIVLLGCGLFAIFSLISFRYQHVFEARSQPNFSKDLSRTLTEFRDGILDVDYGAAQKIDQAKSLLDEATVNEEKVIGTQLISSAYDSFRNFYLLLPDITGLIAAKEDISNLSPGELSLGGKFIRNLSFLSEAADKIDSSFERLINTYKKGRTDIHGFNETRLLIDGFSNEIKAIASDADEFREDLSNYTKIRFIHSGLLSYFLPFWTSFFLLLMGSVIMICKIL